MATLAPCLVRLRGDINTLCPGRDHASDGWIGDVAHQQEESDHNPDARGVVHAIDTDDDLNYPNLSMEMIVQHVLARCRSGAETRLKYVIYRRRIWEASNGWRQRTYTGPSAHEEHAHFSCSYNLAREQSTASWHLEDIPIMMTEADRQFISGQIAALRAEVNQVPAETMDRMITDYADPASPKAKQSLYDWVAYTNARQAALEAKLNEILDRLPAPTE